ncbi:Probable ABC transporter ATP-binding protein NosF [Durusdinium trenchii]|uniref:Probable ABC transporter ATP-binding protein NosF n=1 Tax=Durusdinium trenchii TaxID=1381693 RepID=A0ABP0LS35_9DINO
MYRLWARIDNHRERLAALMDCAPQEMAITRNTTEGLNIVGWGLSLNQGDEVLMSDVDDRYARVIFEQRAKRHGLIVRRIKLPVAPTARQTVQLFEEAMTPKTKLIVASHLVDGFGYVLPIRELSELAHDRDAQLLADGALSFGHIPVSMKELGCDYFATSLHKWLNAPLGTGALYVRRDRLEDLWPLYGTRREADDIRKFEDIGTRSGPTIAAIGQALDFYEQLGPERKAARVRYLLSIVMDNLSRVNRVRVITEPDERKRTGLARVAVEGMSGRDLTTTLREEFDIYTYGNFPGPNDGEIVCLLGANGAGKTTTINLFLGFLEPSSGGAFVNGLNVGQAPLETKKHLAYIPEQVALYPQLSGMENLDYFLRLSGIRKSRIQLISILKEAGLDEKATSRRASSYSKGMRQKVGIAIALAKNAKALLLDEPLSGLDPSAANALCVSLRRLRDEGRAILMATHDVFRAKEVGVTDYAGMALWMEAHYQNPAVFRRVEDLGDAGAAGESARLPDQNLRTVGLLLSYTIYFVALGAIAIGVSALLAEKRAALITLVAIWAASIVLAPRIASDAASTIYAEPDAAAISRQLSDASSAFYQDQEYRDAMEKAVLEEYGVEKTEELPIEYGAYTLQRSEEHAHPLFEAIYEQLDDIHGNQESVLRAASIVSPVIALNTLSAGLSGADRIHQKVFTKGAETHRRKIIKQLNENYMYNAGDAGYGYTADESFWREIEDFSFAPPRFLSLFGAYSFSAVILLAYAIGGLVFAMWVAFEVQSNEAVAEWRAALVDIETKGEAPSPYAARPMNLRLPASLPPAALADFAIGSGDLFPTTTKLTGWANPADLFIEYEFANPTVLGMGRFDLTFLVVVILPLVMIAASFDVFAGERERGRAKITAIQAGNIRASVWKRLMLRNISIWAVFSLIALLAAIIAPTPQMSVARFASFLAWAGVSWAYGLFWFAMIACAVAFGRRSETVAAMLFAVWAIFVFAVPAVGGAVAEAAYPPPSRLVFLSEMREGEVEAVREAEKLTNTFLADHPEMALSTEDVPGFFRGAFLSNREAGKRTTPVLEAFTASRENRKTLVERLQFLSPALIANNALVMIAGGDVGRNMAYQEQARAALNDLYERIGPAVVAKQRISIAEFDAIPAFAFQDRTLGQKSVNLVFNQWPGVYEATLESLLFSWWVDYGDAPSTITEAYAGNYGDLFAYNAWRNQFIQWTALPYFRVWNAFGFMLIGMALFKVGVLQGARSPAFYRRVVKIALAFGAPLVVYGVFARVGSTFVTAAAAEIASDSDRQVYERSFFDRFNPQTARDMIDRLPGFTLDTGDDLRGFGGAAGNVLIDGERPSSKDGGLEDALRRIPANQVGRIEVIRGSAGLSEAAGQSVVANVIRNRGETAGSWEVELERAADGIIYPSGEITVARQFGAWETSTKVNAFWERFPLEGPRIQTGPDGTLISSQLEDRPSVLTDAFISSEAERAAAGGVLTLTGRFGRSAFLPDTERLGFDGRLPDQTPDERFFIDFDSVFIEGELGVDWTRPVGSDWSVKLLSLSSFQDLDQEQVVSTERPVGELVSGSTFVRLQDSFETVFRSAVSKSGEGRLRPEFGSEIAYNRLDSRLSLETRDEDVTMQIDLPAANVLVEELRGEAFANLIWRAARKLSVETGFAVEASEISVSGDASNSQRFFFVKPFATLIYDARPGLQLRLGARRSVGQLDFSEFAASASAADDRLLAGNPDLGPDQATRASFTVDLRSEKRGALNVEIFHEWRDDVIEQVELPSGAFGAANAGDGRIWGVTTNASLILSPLIPGGLIEVEADLRDSTFFDPLTAMDRVISDITSPTILAEFRQDLTKRKLAWGFSYRAAEKSTFFFADEESFTRDGEQWSVFIETTRIKGVRTNFSLRNIGKRNFFRERQFFEPSRADVFTGAETIDRDRGVFATLTISGQF